MQLLRVFLQLSILILTSHPPKNRKLATLKHAIFFTEYCYLKFSDKISELSTIVLSCTGSLLRKVAWYLLPMKLEIDYKINR